VETVKEIEKEDFYNALQYVVDKIPKRDILIIMGDLNAQVGSERIITCTYCCHP
jgi:2-phospho-L-lactate guanylyltransferase (CobY/MobA/RfbA family)